MYNHPCSCMRADTINGMRMSHTHKRSTHNARTHTHTHKLTNTHTNLHKHARTHNFHTHTHAHAALHKHTHPHTNTQRSPTQIPHTLTLMEAISLPVLVSHTQTTGVRPISPVMATLPSRDTHIEMMSSVWPVLCVLVSVRACVFVYVCLCVFV